MTSAPVGPIGRAHGQVAAAAVDVLALVARLSGPAEAGQQNQPAAKVPRFDTDVLPLFQAHCVRCHGQKTRKATLDLRTLAHALKGGESGPPVVPGKPEESLLYQKVRDGMM